MVIYLKQEKMWMEEREGMRGENQNSG